LGVEEKNIKPFFFPPKKAHYHLVSELHSLIFHGAWLRITQSFIVFTIPKGHYPGHTSSYEMCLVDESFKRDFPQFDSVATACYLYIYLLIRLL
jgi:hypothetical protein